MRITDVVPAPEEPVTETIGCLRDMLPLSSRWTRGFLAGGRAEQPANSVKREVLSGLIVLTMVFLDALDLLGRTKHERDALVQTVGNYVEHSLPSGARQATGLLDEEGHRVRLVEQPQLPRLRRVFRVPGIEKHSSPGEDPVSLGHERGDPTHAEVLTTRPGPTRQTLGDVALHRRLPEPLVRGVDREFAGGGGDLNGRAGEDELTERSIEGECVNAGTNAQHEHCRRAVDRVTGTHLLRAGLQVIFQTRVIPRVRCSQYGEDAADGQVDVDIR